MNKIIKTKEPIKKSVYNYEKKDFPALSLEQIKNLKKIKLVYGDITTIACDAVVNSANNTLLGGGGVDGAIHAAAGPKLRQECAKLGGCETGEAKITKAYKLPCKYVIHTVGPIYSRDQRETQSEELRNCYYNSLKLAQENNIKTICFPAISTGIFGFPTRLALPIVFDEISKALNEFKNVEQVLLVSYTPIQFKAYTSYFEELNKRASKVKDKNKTKK